MYSCILFAQFSTKSKLSRIGLVKIYAQAFPSSFLFPGGRIFGRMTWPLLFTVFPPGSFKLSLICVIHTLCHQLHQQRLVRQFVIIPTINKFTFQMLARVAAPLHSLQLSLAFQHRRSSAVHHQVTKSNLMVSIPPESPLAFFCLGRISHVCCRE